MGTQKLTKMSPRHQLVAMLLAAGYKNVQVAEAIGCNTNSISRMKESPLFMLAIEEAQRGFADGTLQSVLSKLAGEADASVSTLVELRDNSEIESSTRRGAARDLLFDGYLDRVMPRRQDKDAPDRVVHVHLDSARIGRLQDLLEEDDALEVAFDEIADEDEHAESGRAQQIEHQIRAVTPQDLLDEIELEERLRDEDAA